MATVDCPRCAVPLSPTPATPEGAEPVMVDACMRCGGLWLDADEIVKVAPDLGPIAQAAEALLRTGATAGSSPTGIAACPKCFVAPLEIAFFGVPVDHCPTCRGLWLDGDEHAGFDQEADRQRGLPAPGSASGTYRTAANIAKTGVILCAWCQAETKVERSYMSQIGAICPACNAQRAIKQRELEIADQVTIGDPSTTAVNKLVQQPRAHEPAMFADSNASVYAKGLFVILEVLAAANRCPRCGCSAYSRCGHHH